MNKKIILATFVFIVLLLVCGTSYKVVKKHQERLILVTEKRILEKAKLCFLENKCTGESTTLKNLYDLSYLEKEANPVTKEYYNENSYIKKEENNYTFIVVN